MTRFVHVTVLVMVAVLGASRIARADTGMFDNGAVLAWEKLFIQENGGAFKEPSDPDARLYYFNLAHCQCSKANAGKETLFRYRLTLDKVTGMNRPAEFWVGTSCDGSVDTRESSCRRLASPTLPDVDAVTSTDFQAEFSIYDVLRGPKGMECPKDETDKAIYLLMDTKATGTIDLSRIKNVGQPPGDTLVGVDTNPPPLPEGFAARPNDGGVLLTWTAPTARANDVYWYQALCAKADGTPVKDDPPVPRYRNAATLCGRPEDDLPLTMTDNSATATDTDTAVTLPEGLKNLDESFICGEANTGASTKLQIDGLLNGAPYTIAVIAADLHGNYVGTYFAKTVTPAPAIDFWEDLNDRDSDFEGGFCLLAETYGDDSSLTSALRAFRDGTLGGSSAGRWLGELYYATLGNLGAYVHGTIALRIVVGIVLAPVVAVALLWHWLTLPGLLGLVALACMWRRRRSLSGWGARLLRLRVSHVGAGVAILLVGTSQAHAGGYQPYWENTNIPSAEEIVAPDDPSLVKWHAGIRVGPYLPEIDKKLGASNGPFEEMFGGSRPMPILDVDRILWTGFGQVAVGGSIGYMQWFAHSFVDGSMPGPMRPRSPGDTNTFRLIPLALTASYRFTYLDDEYGIPVVPYVRGGFAYNVWWLKTRGNRVCKDGSTDLMCELDQPRGGSLGLQGSIGLAIRAERIDASTANSMRQSGIQHAGIYGELSIAKVDGFGSDSKLSLGDRTWFAGVNFEF
jgi:hypothetical protein